MEGILQAQVECKRKVPKVIHAAIMAPFAKVSKTYQMEV